MKLYVPFLSIKTQPLSVCNWHLQLYCLEPNVFQSLKHNLIKVDLHENAEIYKLHLNFLGFGRCWPVCPFIVFWWLQYLRV